MKIKLNPVEQHLANAVEMALLYLTRQRVERREYLELMGALRDAARFADRKELGCPQGLHYEQCFCTDEKPSHYIEYFKRYGRTKRMGKLAVAFVMLITMAKTAIAYTDGYCNIAPPSCSVNSDCPSGSFSTMQYFNCPVATDPPFCGLDGHLRQPTYGCVTNANYTGICFLGSCTRTLTITGTCGGCGAGDCNLGTACSISCTSYTPWLNSACGGPCGIGSRQQTRSGLPAGCTTGPFTQCVADPTCTAPTITAFTATPTTIIQGNFTTLNWTATNATSLVITGIGDVTAAVSVSTAPSYTTTYTLTATNSIGSVSQSVSVTVTALPRCGPGTICGDIHAAEQSALVIPNWPVELRDYQGNVKETVASDTAGHFVFPTLPAGSYWVKVATGRNVVSSPGQQNLQPGNPVITGFVTVRGIPATLNVSAPSDTFILVSTFSYTGSHPPTMAPDGMTSFWTANASIGGNSTLQIPGGLLYWMTCWKPGISGYTAGASTALKSGTTVWPLDTLAETCP